MSPALAGGFFPTEPPGKPMLCCALASQLCQTLCNPMDCSPTGSSVHGDSPGQNTGVGCHALLQGIFSTQGMNTGLLHCRQILYCLNHQGSPYIRYFIFLYGKGLLAHMFAVWPTHFSILSWKIPLETVCRLLIMRSFGLPYLQK